MPDKSKFKFANDITIEEDYLEEEQTEVVFTKKVISPGAAKRAKRQRNLKSALTMLIISAILVAGGLFWQDDYDLMAWGDALWLAFALEFFFGWVLLVYNMNIFSPLLYGAKTFILMFVGKRPKTDYYHYMLNVQNNQIDKYYYIVVFLSAGVLLIPSIITLFMLL